MVPAYTSVGLRFLCPWNVAADTAACSLCIRHPLAWPFFLEILNLRALYPFLSRPSAECGDHGMAKRGWRCVPRGGGHG